MNALMAQTADGMTAYAGAAEPQAPQYQEWSLDKKVRCFEDSEEATDTARQVSERCRDYYDGKQLTAAELAELTKRGQPDIIINRIQSKVNYLLGYEAALRTDPRGRPRTPEDEEASEACTDALNYVRDTSDQKQAFSQCWENMLIEGAGGSEVVPVLKQGDADIKIKKVHWDRAFWDPHSREHDFEDARYLGQVIWMDEEDALAQWPNAGDAITKTISDEARITYSDRPRWRQWATVGAHRKRVRIVQMYYKCRALDNTGEECWHWCIFTKGGEIEAGQVPYRDDDENSLCPLVLESAFIDRDNNRYGFVKALLGPQDEINKRRSKLLHEATMRQFIYEDGALDDVDATKQEAAKPDGSIKVNPGSRFEFVDRSKEIAAHGALQTEAKQEIELMGPNAAMLGEAGGAPSGRAILANQSGGQIELALLVDRHNHYKARIHRLVWSMIKLYWTEEKWVRVTDDEDNVRFVGFNRPLTLAEVLLKQAEDEGIDPDEAKGKLREAAQDPMLAAQLQEVVKMDRVPSEMGMDIVLDQIPDNANIQQEQFQVLGDLAKSGIPLPPKLLIKASALRNKKELLEELDKAEEQAANDPLQQAAVQAQMETAMAEIEKLRAEIAKIAAETEKTLAEVKNTEADSVKKLAEADAVDMQMGSVVDPAIVGPGQSSSSSPDGMGAGPAQSAPQREQNPMISQAISDQAAQMQPQPMGEEMGDPYMDQGLAQQAPTPELPQPAFA